MARRVGPVRPRVKDAKSYEQAIRKAFLDPMFRSVRTKFATVEGSSQAFRAMDEVVEAILAQPRSGVPIVEIQKALNEMQGYSRKKVLQTFRSALGVSVDIMLLDLPVVEFMRGKVSENVDLIKTIPTRMHESLKLRLQKEL